MLELHRGRFVEWTPSAVTALAVAPGGALVACARESGAIEAYDGEWRCVARVPGSCGRGDERAGVVRGVRGRRRGDDAGRGGGGGGDEKRGTTTRTTTTRRRGRAKSDAAERLARWTRSGVGSGDGTDDERDGQPRRGDLGDGGAAEDADEKRRGAARGDRVRRWVRESADDGGGERRGKRVGA